VRLKVLTPVEVVLDRDVAIVVAEGANGSFGLKPRHADFVSSLVPGLLHFREREGEEGEYMAVDRGLLVKQGDEVLVSVRSAVRGVGLEELVRAVEERFSVLDDHERSVRSAVARLESDFVRRFMELK
jgi:F-type H+-transporting ATPase subunit epsilon